MLDLFGKIDKTFIRKRKLKEIDFKQLEAINKVYLREETAIDHTTWKDLDMDNIFSEINYTVTTPGEERLYSWLKNPMDNETALKERQDYLSHFQKESSISQKLRKKLSKIKYYPYNFREIMGTAFFVNYLLLIIFILLSLTNLGIIVYSLSIDINAFIFLLLVSSVNIFIHFRFNTKYGIQLQALSYLIKILVFSKNNKKFIHQVMPELGDRIDRLNAQLKGITNKGAVLFRVEGLDLLADYFNIVFLMKEINFLMISRQVNKHKEEIMALYLLIGELDAILSINRYREDLDYYCEPIIIENEPQIRMTDMYHPLVENPISNSIEVNQSIAITGSNMSGKSTFLRSIGLNVLFAQSICTSLSKAYRSTFYRLITSISLNDDVLQGKSYFLSEAEAIKRMVELKDDDYPSLILIDEVFKGTNPVERLAASMEILNTLAAANTKTLVATHDLQILPELHDYDYYYFTEHVTKDALEFDYKIRKGITTTRNAVKILAFIKYPEDLINRINKRIEEVELSYENEKGE
ncbi:DNA mismatch repair protein MutS [Vallitalea pronyensis]|uniref:DNA mismatch repair protein MutS n=1 Tax=Vallitalea pronyensis TaxID=1348613 RepID=A0A8J8SH48_9FIRM|nr:DNA mismatch repair protein MutS [Vallitalea pronyensis]QUI23037.1 DNA mismatch repair protein MutS [Vallitalea pronyensis]